MQKVPTWTMLMGVLVLAAGLAACSGQAPPAVAPTATPKPPAAVAAPTKAPAAQPAATAKPTAQPAAPAKPTAQPAAAAKPTAAPKAAGADLSPQFADLQTAVAVQSAMAYVDGAGFHGMGEDLETAKEVNSRYVGTVRNVLAVVGAVPWPSDLAKEQKALAADLKALEPALVANKVEDAHKAAEAIHESQHDLSKATYAWLKGQSKLSQVAIFKEGDVNHMLGCIGVQSAIAYVDGAGFHGMGEDLKTAKEVNSRYVGTVRNVLAVVGAVPWPSDLAKEQKALADDLKAFEPALVANEVEEAQKIAEAVHESEHDLSKATYAWLKGQNHNFGAMMGMMAGNKMMQGAMVTGVQSAMAYVDKAGFHGMGEDLEKAKEVNSRYVGTVRNVLAVISAAPWPSELAKEQKALVDDLKALEPALVANKVAEAHEAAEAIHESQHDLSKATFSWLGTRKGG